MKVSREQALVLCAAFLFAGMLVLAQYDVYAVELLIREKEEFREELRRAGHGSAGNFLRAVRVRDGDSSPDPLVGGDT